MIRVALFLLFANCYVLSLKEEEITAAWNFLRHYGYLPKDFNPNVPNEEMLSEGIKNFQNMAGMNMTGNLDDEAMAIMKMPRCGMKDMDKPAMFSATPYPWQRREFTYNIMSYPSGIPRAVVDVIIKRAFNIWSKYTNLKFFKRNYDNVNFKIGWTGRNHGDGNNFDGRGKVLAHAFFPTDGRIHFDNEENWSTSSGEELTNIYQVAAHEIGHALGLGHSEVVESLMTPYYEYNKKFNTELHRDDIRGINYLYGNNRVSRLTTNPDMTEPLLCNQDPINSIFFWKNSFYVFKGNNYIKLTEDLSFLKSAKISSLWNGVTNNVKAVSNGENIFFFRNNKYWKFTDTKLNDGYPNDISVGFPGIPSNFDAVMHFKREFIFFKGDQYWVYNPRRNPAVTPLYPKSIKTTLNGFPGNLDAIYSRNQNIYGFKGDLVHVYNVRDGDASDPISVTKDFFGCAS